MNRVVWAISIVLTLVAANMADAQGTLQHVHDNVHPSSPADSNSNSSSGASNVVNDFFGGVFSSDTDLFTGAATISLVALAPFIGPLVVLEDGYENRRYFAPYPYAGNVPGYHLLSTDSSARLADFDSKEVIRKQWAVRLTIEDGNDFAGLNRLGGSIKIENAGRWGVVSNWNYFRERLPCGCIDEALMGDTNITFRFAQNQTASFYTGVGVRMWSDGWRTDFGFNFTYGGDWFPMRPLVVSGVFDAGNLGSAGVIHARGSVGAILYRCEVFAGYDFLRIGSTNLQGPMVGVRLWF